MDKNIVQLTKRSMANNIVVSGIEGDDAKENCHKKVLEFFNATMDMETQRAEILVAHRLGKKEPGKIQPMVVRCAHDLRSRVFKHTLKLKDKTNSIGVKYYVDVQLPEPLATQYKENRQQLAAIRKLNDTLDEAKKVKAEMKWTVIC